MDLPVADSPATADRPHIPFVARWRADAGEFYGWWIAGACAALMFAGVGVGYYGLAVLLRPLQDEHGWSNGVVSGATGLYFSVSGVASALSGRVIDRRGPRTMMLAGCTTLGLGVAVIGAVESVWQLYALYVVIAIGFGCGVNVGVSATMARWFVHRRARAISISSTGVSLGGMVLAPVGTMLVDRGGVGLAAFGMGVLVLVVTLPAIAFVLVFDPSDVGMEPDGGVQPPSTTGRASLSDDVQRRSWEMSDVLRTSAFWCILAAFVLAMAAQTGFAIHQISFLEERLGSRSAAAFALSTTAFGSIIARLVVGSFADRLDKQRLTAVLFAVQGVAVLGVIATDSIIATYALVLCFGFTIGNIYMMQSLLVSEVFGLVSFGSVFGLIVLGSAVASGLGPLMVGVLETATGSYTASFVVTALMTFAAAAFALAVRPPARL